MSADQGIVDKNSNDSILLEGVDKDNLLKEQPSDYRVESIDNNQLSDHEIVPVYDKNATQQKKDQTFTAILLYL